MPLSYCIAEGKPYVRWVEKYFKDCLCNLRDDFSFGLGLVSLVCWGDAKIPQIITNFQTKSSHGVSLAFLLTWVAGKEEMYVASTQQYELLKVGINTNREDEELATSYI
ncbi:hypothetical protein ABKV19_027665 [Rosa sericea]